MEVETSQGRHKTQVLMSFVHNLPLGHRTLGFSLWEYETSPVLGLGLCEETWKPKGHLSWQEVIALADGVSLCYIQTGIRNR